jgi:hypothetical protein
VILPRLHQHIYLTGEGKNDLFITTPWQEDIYNVHVRAKSNRGEERLEFKFCREEKIVLVRLHCMPEMTNVQVPGLCCMRSNELYCFGKSRSE